MTALPAPLWGQAGDATGIRGMVTNAQGAPLADVRVIATHEASGSRRAAVTGGEGQFTIAPLAPGSYRLQTEHVGYAAASRRVDLTEAGVADLRLMLQTEAIELGGINVIGTRSAQAQALEEKRLATNIRDVTVADQVGKLPDRGLAEAVSRLAGVSVRQGIGDARYIMIRGISPELNQVNVNGQISAISDAAARAGRAGPMDVVGAGDFASIEVIKTLTPDLDAHGLGGQINVVTPSALTYGGRFASFQGDYGGNGLNDQSDFSFSFGGGDLFMDRRLGVYVGGSFSRRDFTFDRLEGRWTEIDGLGHLPYSQMLKYVDEERDRWSASANVEYTPSDRSLLYLRTVVNQVDEFGHRPEVNTRLRSGLSLASPTSGAAEQSSIELKTRDQNSLRRIANLTLGLEQFLGGRGSWLWEPIVTYSNAIEDREIVYVDSDYSARIPATFDYTDYFYSIEAPGRFDAGQILVDRIRFDGGLQDEDLIVLQNDLTWTSPLDRLFDQQGHLMVKFGGKATLRDRAVDEYSNRYRPNEAMTLAGFTAEGPAEFRDRFAFGPLADAQRLRDYYEQNPDRFYYDEVSSIKNGVEDDYDADENIFAGFAMAELNVGDITVLGGARLEHTELTIGAFQATEIDDEFTGISPRSLESSYTNIFPNLQARWAPGRGLVTRAAITTSLGRPDFVDLAPITELEAVEIEPGVFVGGVEEGNPGLLPYEAVNADFAVEYYFGTGGLIAVNLFQKWVDNPVFERREELQGVTYDDRFFETLDLRTTRNADNGEIQGLELSYQQQFAFLPGLLDGLGVAANAAFMDSEVAVFEREELLPFFGQPDHIYNAQVFYERSPIQARVAYQRSGEYLLALGGSLASDVYEDTRETIDAKLTLQVQPNAFVFVEGLNVTGEDRRIFQGEAGRLLLDEQFGAVYRAGFSWRF